MCTTVEVGGKSVLNNLIEQDITKTKAKVTNPPTKTTPETTRL